MITTFSSSHIHLPRSTFTKSHPSSPTPSSALVQSPLHNQSMSSGGFDLGPFHVPQQCRRHKLRSFDVLANAGHHLVDLPPSLSVNPNSSSAATTHVLDTREPSCFRLSPSMTTQGLSLSLSPGPFTVCAEVLSSSRFLRPAQQLMEELFDVGRTRGPACLEGIDVDMDRVFDGCSAGMVVDDHGYCGRRKTRLVFMLNEVCRGYRHYYQQMQAVIASFESVHGLTKAAPFTPLVLKSITKHFRNLKNAITAQLQPCKTRIEDGANKDDEPHFRISDQNLDQRLAHTAPCGYEQPHVWRPQRGLPERAVAVLKAWLFEHFLHPYPTDMDKQILAKQTGLSRNQVSNWFINARVRLWKPMVEEIHSLEMRQAQKAAECSNQDQNKQCNTSNIPSIPSIGLSQSNTSRIDQPICTKNQSSGSELTSLVPNHHTVQPINLSHYSNPSHREETVGAAVGHQFLGGNSGVSLTLGLHQTNVACLTEPHPLSVPQFGRAGLGGSNANISYGQFGGFNSQIRHFDTQLLHD